MRRWLLLVMFIMTAPSLADAACSGSSPTLTAASASRADFAACETLAVDGDTINVPAGTATWSPHYTITNKSIKIVGAGIGNTVITFSEAVRSCGIVWVTKATGGSPEISGFTLKSTTCGDGTDLSNVLNMAGSVSGISTTVRVHHMRIEASGTAGGLRMSNTYGLVDHNELVNTGVNTHASSVQRDAHNGVADNGDFSWSLPSSVGTADTVTFEDNTFSNTHPTDGRYCTNDTAGSRTAYRFNTYINCSVQEHGFESGGRTRASMHTEVYRNLWTWNHSAGWGSLIAFRGGSGFVFDNTATTTLPGTLTRLIDFNTFRGGPSPRPADATGSPGYYPMGYCEKMAVTLTRSGTTATATVSVLDHGILAGNGSYVDITGASDSNFNRVGVVGTRVSKTQFTYPVANTGSTSDSGTKQATLDGNTDNTGYPCMDQMGRGTGNLLAGYGPGATALSPLTPINQALVPVVMVHNLLNASVSNGGPNNGADVMLANRDYFNQDASCTGASCTAGIGRGTSLPTGCTPTATLEGPYYWKTNSGSWNTSTTETYSDTPGEDGVLYKCSATNTWSVYYTPYTYPHPLIPASTPPAPDAIGATNMANYHTATMAIFQWPKSVDANHKAYKVYRCLTADPCTNLIATITPASAALAHQPENRYVDSSLYVGTSYYFSVADQNLSDYIGPAGTPVSVAVTGKP